MATLRFLHTGDWHLGKSYRNVPDPELAVRLREARLDAVARILDVAREWAAAFVLAAGDQFDAEMPDPRWLRGLLERIAAAPDVVVHMIPGNHDPARTGSVYEWSEFRTRPENLRFHSQPEAVALGDWGATLFPCPCHARFGPDPLTWVPPRSEGDGLRIGLAHGSLPSIPAADGRNYPIAADAAACHDLDYLALGDWHAPYPDPAESPRERMYYAGTPEIGGWDETRGGFALAVELEAGCAPRVEAVRVGRMEWLDLAPRLDSDEDLGALEQALLGSAATLRFVRLRPTGILSALGRERLEMLVRTRAVDFAGLITDDRGLRLSAEVSEPETVDPLISATLARLKRLAASPGEAGPVDYPEDLPSYDADVVGRAIARFQGLI
jgi:DNA repair exonuclease SbcCD nuclease subunit